jgi:hypothetical protein
VSSTTGVDGDRQLPHGAVGQPAAARLVAREALAVEQQHARARARERKAAVEPAGPAPTTIASKRSIGPSYD